MVNWIKFWALAFIWGSSFLLIKMAVDDLGTLPLVSIRLGGAAVIFAGYVLWTKRKFPTDPTQRAALVFVGLFNTAVPFFLITWGETRIDSGLATVLNSTVPLFGLIIAHFTLSDEHLSPLKIVGLLVGFVGVIIVMSQSIGTAGGDLVGQLAVLAASASYGVCIISIRIFLRKADPFTVAGYSTMIGGVIIVTATLLTVNPLPTPNTGNIDSFLAASILAVVNTVVAYFLFFRLINDWGARATLVTYAMPPIGVTLGYLFLDEAIGWHLVVGAILIIGGIVVTKRQVQPEFVEKPKVATLGAD